MRIIYRGVSTPLLDTDDEAKLQASIDLKKLFCLQCKRQYDTATTLQRHAMRHLGYSRYKCTLCKFTSADKSECENHCKKSHTDQPSDGVVGSCVIDLSTLVDESKDEGVVGRTVKALNVPATENGGTKTRSRSKENTGSSDADTSLESREQNEADTSMSVESGKDKLTTFPYCDFGLEFPDFVKIIYLSRPGNSNIIHCGILINIPYVIL